MEEGDPNLAGSPDEELDETQNKGPSYEELQRQQYLDPEGGYSNPE